MDLSYILNSPDVERVATALETIADKTVETMNGKLDKQQGSGNAGKALVVGPDGNIWFGNVGIPDSVKTALLNLVQHVAYTDDQGQSYYNALYAALYNGEPPVPPTPVVPVPDLSAFTSVDGYYFNNDGEEVESESAKIIRDYMPVAPEQEYVWAGGFAASQRRDSESDIVGACVVYRVCFYTSDLSFISRVVGDYSTDPDYVEPRYFRFTTPSGAAFIRVSWNITYYPGEMALTIPSDLYSVHLALARINDGNITDPYEFAAGVTIWRNGQQINRDTNWYNNVFNFAEGESPELNSINLIYNDKRIMNGSSILLKRGDVLRFASGVKYGVYCEKIDTGEVMHTTAWVTDSSDYVIGGGENG